MRKRKRLAASAAELVKAKVDLIMVGGGSSKKRAGKATQTIPIVVGRSGSLGRYGFVASLVRPGGNVTRSTFKASALDGKRLGLLKESQTSPIRVASYKIGTKSREQK